jgi:hypothetical protein
MYLLDKENLTSIAKAVKNMIDHHDSELKHCQILDAIAKGLGKNDYHDLSETAIVYDGIKSKKLFVDSQASALIMRHDQ